MIHLFIPVTASLYTKDSLEIIYPVTKIYSWKTR
jgi:hypothetical protein